MKCLELVSVLCIFTATTAAYTENPSILLSGGPQIVQDELIQVNGKLTLREIWRWRPETSAAMPDNMILRFLTTDECKPVSGGREILITSSAGGVALVSHETGATLFYAAVRNAHSAELLPRGLIAVASSTSSDKTGDRLVLFDRNTPNKPLDWLDLPAAHGVVWDSKRNVLWALGGEKLLRLHIVTKDNRPHFVVESTTPLPAVMGHDLQISADASTLYVSNTQAVYAIQPESMQFAPFTPLKGVSNIKSLSINPISGQILYTQAGHVAWWTYTLHFLHPDHEISMPCVVYKARWYHP